MLNFHQIRSMNYYLIILALFLLYNPFPLVSAAEGGYSSAYDILQSYDFPVGLLPKGSTGYDLDEKTGKFNVYFNKSCSFSLEGSYQLKYNSKISGYITEGKLSKLSGISVKVLILWLNIAEVTIDGDNLEFSVGIASADFPINNFDIIPQCGCGLNCNEQLKKILRSPLVSSLHLFQPH
ncbi:hypothetical protein ACH5RR_010807 [Cinchona calisaya]|uniref:Uncharacterized protein n=1 Tax=Cinchona calisaya TaxID=153742 RepID=A0ABD3AJZ8_9GENT